MTNTERLRMWLIQQIKKLRADKIPLHTPAAYVKEGKLIALRATLKRIRRNPLRQAVLTVRSRIKI